MRFTAVILVLGLYVTLVYAFEPIPPRVLVFSSLDGKTLIRVDPGNKGEVKPLLHLFDFQTDTNTYREIKRFVLQNSVLPEDVCVVPGCGYIIAVGDWDESKREENALALYDNGGNLLRKWSFEMVMREAGESCIILSEGGRPALQWHATLNPLYVRGSEIYILPPVERKSSGTGFRIDLDNLRIRSMAHGK